MPSKEIDYLPLSRLIALFFGCVDQSEEYDQERRYGTTRNFCTFSLTGPDSCVHTTLCCLVGHVQSTVANHCAKPARKTPTVSGAPRPSYPSTAFKHDKLGRAYLPYMPRILAVVMSMLKHRALSAKSPCGIPQACTRYS